MPAIAQQLSNRARASACIMLIILFDIPQPFRSILLIRWRNFKMADEILRNLPALGVLFALKFSWIAWLDTRLLLRLLTIPRLVCTNLTKWRYICNPVQSFRPDKCASTESLWYRAPGLSVFTGGNGSLNKIHTYISLDIIKEALCWAIAKYIRLIYPKEIYALYRIHTYLQMHTRRHKRAHKYTRAQFDNAVMVND